MPAPPPDLTLRDIVAPLSPETFLAEVFHKRFEFMPGSENRFDGLFSWRDVNALLKHGRVAPPFIRLARHGRDLPTARYTTETDRGRGRRESRHEIVPERLECELRQGATLIMNHVSQTSTPLHELCRNLERELGTPANINLYAGWRTDNGLARHWDDHDVFILQIDGRKKWEVYADTRPKPLPEDKARVPRIPKQPLWTGLLTRGDVLYIPRGCWHVAYPLDEPSLHLTTGLGTCSGETVLSWLRHALLPSACFRDDVPLTDGPEGVTRYLTALKDEIDRVLSDDPGDAFLAWSEERADRSLDTALPGAAANGKPPASPVRLELRVARRLRVRGADGAPYVSLRVKGGSRRFPAGARPLIEFLAGGGRATADALAGMCADPLTADNGRRIVDNLFQEGVLRVVPADAGLMETVPFGGTDRGREGTGASSGPAPAARTDD